MGGEDSDQSESSTDQSERSIGPDPTNQRAVLVRSDQSERSIGPENFAAFANKDSEGKSLLI